MAAKKDNEKKENLLEAIFNLIWDKLFPGERIGTISDEELEEILPTLPEMIEYKLPKRDKREGIFIPIGQTYKGESVVLDLKANPHTVVTGVTGAGKSVCIKEMIVSLMRNYSSDEIELHFIDFKIVEMSLYKRCSDYVKSYVTEIEEAKDLLADLMEECKRRYHLFDELEVTNLWDYNKLVPPEKQLKKQIIIIEEFVEFTQDRKKIAMALLKRFSSLARASGQYLILTGQRFDNTVIDLVLRNNLSNRIVFQMSDEANSKLLLGVSGAEKINVKGRCYVKVNADVKECQSYYISDTEVKKLIKPYIKPKDDRKVINDNKTSKNGSERETDIKEDNNKIIDLSFLENI